MDSGSFIYGSQVSDLSIDVAAKRNFHGMHVKPEPPTPKIYMLAADSSVKKILWGSGCGATLAMFFFKRHIANKLKISERELLAMVSVIFIATLGIIYTCKQYTPGSFSPSPLMGQQSKTSSKLMSFNLIQRKQSFGVSVYCDNRSKECISVESLCEHLKITRGSDSHITALAKHLFGEEYERYQSDIFDKKKFYIRIKEEEATLIVHGGSVPLSSLVSKSGV